MQSRPTATAHQPPQINCHKKHEKSRKNWGSNTNTGLHQAQAEDSATSIQPNSHALVQFIALPRWTACQIWIASAIVFQADSRGHPKQPQWLP
ncbi:hypothetical protein Enr13x_70800 [Stieleria neptunia]|uniref:Uncharacterized protein n=1 Tax=Stieleria neptunia TaxID=2527979 RepID=A0A518I260_9BACT|nr:hypothetical protein Enr13x_70800 [Stieleria neptunia]